MTRKPVRKTALFTLLILLAGGLWVNTASAADQSVIPDFSKSLYRSPMNGEMNTYLRPGDGPTLVLVPGTWGGIWRFESLIAALPQSMSIAVVELSWQDGHKPKTLNLTMEGLADDVLQAIDALGISQFVIAGHSIGGMIAVEIAGRDVPGLVGAIPMEGWTHHTVVATAFDGVVVDDLSPEEEAARQADRIRGRSHLSEAELHAIGSIWKTWNGYAGLERATIPILELWGDRGKAHPDRKALQIPERSNIRIGWIPQASHLMLMEDPAEVARQVRKFMTNLRAATSKTK